MGGFSLIQRFTSPNVTENSCVPGQLASLSRQITDALHCLETNHAGLYLGLGLGFRVSTSLLADSATILLLYPI